MAALFVGFYFFFLSERSFCSSFYRSFCFYFLRHSRQNDFVKLTTLRRARRLKDIITHRSIHLAIFHYQVERERLCPVGKNVSKKWQEWLSLTVSFRFTFPAMNESLAVHGEGCIFMQSRCGGEELDRHSVRQFVCVSLSGKFSHFSNCIWPHWPGLGLTLAAQMAVSPSSWWYLPSSSLNRFSLKRLSFN